MECIIRLSDAMDDSMDDRISVEEIIEFVEKRELPFEEGVCYKMFDDAIEGRGFINEAQRTGPINHVEIAKACRGRHQWNTEAKEWQLRYRPYRNHWIVLLLTVNTRIFALPMPKIIPEKIQAQYEHEEDFKQNAADSMLNMSQKKQMVGSNTLTADIFSPSIDKKYNSVKATHVPVYQRNTQKTEGNIKPEIGGLIKIAGKKTKLTTE